MARPSGTRGPHGPWHSITGGVDLGAIQLADETIPTTAVEQQALKALAYGPTAAMHPATLTWIQKGKFWFPDKEKYLTYSGQCCLLQIGPDGVLRAVQWTASNTSTMNTVESAIVHWTGGYADLEPIQPLGASTAGGTARDLSWPSATPWSNTTRPARTAFYR